MKNILQNFLFRYKLLLLCKIFLRCRHESVVTAGASSTFGVIGYRAFIKCFVFLLLSLSFEELAGTDGCSLAALETFQITSANWDEALCFTLASGFTVDPYFRIVLAVPAALLLHSL